MFDLIGLKRNLLIGKMENAVKKKIKLFGKKVTKEICIEVRPTNKKLNKYGKHCKTVE